MEKNWVVKNSEDDSKFYFETAKEAEDFAVFLSEMYGVDAWAERQTE